jgi:hypothetical protein
MLSRPWYSKLRVFCVVTPCSVMVGYQRFRGQPWRWRQHGSPKRWYPTILQHGITTQETSSWNTIALKAAELVLSSYVYFGTFSFTLRTTVLKDLNEHLLNLYTCTFWVLKEILIIVDIQHFYYTNFTIFFTDVNPFYGSFEGPNVTFRYSFWLDRFWWHPKYVTFVMGEFCSVQVLFTLINYKGHFSEGLN